VGGRDWEEGVECAWGREVVLRSAEFLPNYPLLIEYEWEGLPGSTTFGRGDLVFGDGSGHFAVVEVKTIEGSGKRTNRRTKVEEQALRYAAAWERRHPGSVVQALVYTDDYLYPGLRTAGGPRENDAGPFHPHHPPSSDCTS